MQTSRNLLGASWGRKLEMSVRVPRLAPSWGRPGDIVGRLGGLWGPLGALLGLSWRPLGLSWGDSLGLLGSR
eukprot:6440485-Pyramimonas_sp.AAC.1